MNRLRFTRLLRTRIQLVGSFRRSPRPGDALALLWWSFRISPLPITRQDIQAISQPCGEGSSEFDTSVSDGRDRDTPRPD
jgi:hypothetical protein